MMPKSPECEDVGTDRVSGFLLAIKGLFELQDAFPIRPYDFREYYYRLTL